MSARDITPDFLRSWLLPSLPSGSDKETRGRVLVVAGGAEIPGAAVLAGLGALRAGAGKLQMAAPVSVARQMAFEVPEARVIPVAEREGGDLSPEAADALVALAARTDAVVLGPGMMDETVACDLAGTLTSSPTEAAFVFDAAALTALVAQADQLLKAAGRIVLTPHAGEMAALLGIEKSRVEADPPAAAREVARNLGAVVVMKGETTWIASPDGVTWRHDSGAVGLATSGSGDVLAGVIGGLLARGAPAAQAAIWGVALHGAAGAALTEAIGPLGFLAREILPEVPRALARLAR